MPIRNYEWYEQGLLKSKELLLSKYNINEINKFCRTTYPFTKPQIEAKGIKLNIGCYYMYIDSFINVDINPKVKPDLVCNMIDIDKHFSPNSVSLILISQCLEHVTKEDGIKILTKFFNILNSGGQLIVEVPDGNDLNGRLMRGEITKHVYDLLKTGHREVAHQGHDSTYETEELKNILSNIGFTNIVSMPLEMTSDKVESIRVDCVKP
jgi:predicted SAM-dependent methyltransferase